MGASLAAGFFQNQQQGGGGGKVDQGGPPPLALTNQSWQPEKQSKGGGYDQKKGQFDQNNKGQFDDQKGGYNKGFDQQQKGGWDQQQQKGGWDQNKGKGPGQFDQNKGGYNKQGAPPGQYYDQKGADDENKGYNNNYKGPGPGPDQIQKGGPGPPMALANQAYNQPKGYNNQGPPPPQQQSQQQKFQPYNNSQLSSGGPPPNNAGMLLALPAPSGGPSSSSQGGRGAPMSQALALIPDRGGPNINKNNDVNTLALRKDSSSSSSSSSESDDPGSASGSADDIDNDPASDPHQGGVQQPQEHPGPRKLWQQLCLAGQGAFYSSDDLNLSLKHEYKAGQGRVAIYFVNKSQYHLNNVKIEVNQVPASSTGTNPLKVNRMDKNVTPTLAPGASFTHYLVLDVLCPFLQPPKYIVTYNLGREENQLPLTLPTILTKFASPDEYRNNPEFNLKRDFGSNFQALNGMEKQNVGAPKINPGPGFSEVVNVLSSTGFMVESVDRGKFVGVTKVRRTE